MPARKVAKKTAKKGGTIDADLTSIAVPFGLLLAKQSLEKLSGTKVKATKGKKVVKNVAKAKTTKRMKRVAVGGNNTVSNGIGNTGNAGIGNAVNVVNTGNASGANSSVTGGKSVKKGRGRPRSRVGGNNVPGVTNSTLGSGNVSGGRAKRKTTKSKKGGETTSKKTRKTQKGGANNNNADKINAIAQKILETNDLNVDNDAAINTAINDAIIALLKEDISENDKEIFRDISNNIEIYKPAIIKEVNRLKAQDQDQAAKGTTNNGTGAQDQVAANGTPNLTGTGGKSKAKRGRGRPRKN